MNHVTFTVDATALQATVNRAVSCFFVRSNIPKVEQKTLDKLRRRLRKLREVRSLSQEDVAHLAGIDYKFYQSIEAGRRKELRVSTVERIAKAYGLQAYQLLAPKLSMPKSRTSIE